MKLLGALAAVALTAAACGSSSSGSTTSSTAAATSGGSGDVVVKTATVNGTTALVDSKGWTLYTFSLDKPGSIACTGGCTSIWPPLLVPAGQHLSMSMAGLGTETRPGGKVQVTYKGAPLYTYSGDTGPAQDHGITIPHWSIASTSASSSSTTTSSSSSGGYGY